MENNQQIPELVPCQGNEDKCVIEAKNELAHYNKYPFKTKFLEDYGIRNGGQAQVDKLPFKRASKPSCGDLLKRIDEFKMWGKQHIFLFSLKNGEEKYLRKLSRKKYILEQLANCHLDNRYMGDICAWKTKEPCLVDVRHVRDPAEEVVMLIYKWVETRKYQEMKNRNLVDKEERSVNFFIINLRNGTAELRIQLLPTRAEHKLQEKFDLYISILRRLLDFDRFSIMSLEPVMKRFLYKNILPITNWSIKVYSGKLKGNIKNPTLMEKLQLPFINFFPQEITLFWECDQVAHNRSKLYFTLNGYQNSVTFAGITDSSRVNFIISKLRLKQAKNIESEKIKNNKLDSLKKEFPHDTRILFMIDFYFRKLKTRELNSAEFSQEIGYSEERITEVFKNAAIRFSKKFIVKEEAGHSSLKIWDLTHDGFIERVFKDIDKPKTTKGKRILKYSSGVIFPLIVRGIFSNIINWQIGKLTEELLGFPTIVLEVLTQMSVLLLYYGGKRGNIVSRHVPTYIKKKLVRSVIKPEQILDIDEDMYDSWLQNEGFQFEYLDKSSINSRVHRDRAA